MLSKSFPYLSDSTLKKAVLVIFTVWVAVQAGLAVYFWGVPQQSDAQTYIRIAERCIRAGAWYPNETSVYSPYIWNPGFVNFLVLQLKVFGTVNANVIFNIFMNIGAAAGIFVLARRYFNVRTAYLAVVLYCLTYSNLFVVLSAGTEIPFLFLATTALCLCGSRKYRWIILAGVLFALANWVRPLVLIFLPAALGMFALERRRSFSYVALLVPMLLVILAIGKASEVRMGYFVTQSTTSPVNLIMTANDKAYGGVATSIFSDKTSSAYIENEDSLTFRERGDIWKRRAIEWIKAHPGRYCALYVKKLAGLYIEDSWADRPILGNSGFADSVFVKKSVGTSEFAATAAVMFLKSVVYYIILALFAYSLVKNWRKLDFGRLLLLSIAVFGTLLTCVFCVSPRYHHPFFFVITIFAASGLNVLLSGKKKEV